uniref:HIT-type domain-containing protein n=1 Tax=Timema tahoe TaxID=61484 RepID=A0A7R9NX91_9NEOP|nr:unnamed protein product [Timema tahoe]
MSTCEICHEKPKSYVCPRCHLPYCSLTCYRSQQHLQCSESFYQEAVKEELEHSTFSEDSNKIVNALQQVHEQSTSLGNNSQNHVLPWQTLSADDGGCSDVEGSLDSDDEDEASGEIPSLHERLQGVNLEDSDQVWESLTLSEQKVFINLCSSDEGKKLQELWQPWWYCKEQRNPFSEMDGSLVDSFTNLECICPKIFGEIPDFPSSLTPSPCVPNNIVNVLAAYTAVVRLEDGMHNTNVSSASWTLANISTVLSCNENFESVDAAISSVCSQVGKLGCTLPDIDAVVQKDVKTILHGAYEEHQHLFVLSALSDTHNVLSKASKTVKKALSPPAVLGVYKQLPLLDLLDTRAEALVPSSRDCRDRGGVFPSYFYLHPNVAAAKKQADYIVNKVNGIPWDSGDVDFNLLESLISRATMRVETVDVKGSLKRSNIIEGQDVCTRKAKPVKPLAITSIFNTLFPLDEVNAKRVIIGMSVKNSFTPYVQLEKCGGNCAVFNHTEWQELGNYKSVISKFFSNTQPSQNISLTNHEISLRRLCGDHMVVISEKQDAGLKRVVYLAPSWARLCEVWDLIDRRDMWSTPVA